MLKKTKEQNGLEFRLIGGAFQPAVENFRQLKSVLALDEAWFAVTGTDISSLRADPVFLKFLDSDQNGKIRTDEVKSAIAFMTEVLKEGEGFNTGSSILKLDDLNLESQTGAEILESAKFVLHNLGKSEADEISLSDITDEKQIKKCILSNGDGVITSAAAAESDENAAKAIELAISFTGAEQDISGENGLNALKLDKFVESANTVLAWYKEADETPELLPFGEHTQMICDQYAVIRDVVDEYFLSSETMAFLDSDPERIARKDSAADVRSPSEVLDLLKKIAVAAPDASGKLDLSGALNPLWRNRIIKFAELPEISQFLENNILSSDNWKELSLKLAPAVQWYSRRPDMPALLKVSKEELEQALSEKTITAIRELIAKDVESGVLLARLSILHKLLLFQANMRNFLKSFLNLEALFEPGVKSLLQTGTLVMDGRHFSLAVPFSNLAEHKRIVSSSHICVAYIEISRGQPGALKKQQLAVAVTSGSMRNLFTGKRGIFFDAAGEVYDAKITDFLQQPVSVAEALKSPFYKLGEFLSKQADKMLTARSMAVQQDISKSLTAGKPQQLPDPRQQQMASGSMLLMGGSIGLAAIGSSIAFIVKSLQNISLLNIIAVLCGIVLIFGGPLVIMSLVKLYRRDLGRFLEASGCALNFPLRLSRELGNFFTMSPARPLSSLAKGQIIADSVVPPKSRKTTIILFTIFFVLLAVFFAVKSKWFL